MHRPQAPVPISRQPSAAPRYLIGIDGGGTATRVLLASLSGQILARTRSGPSGLSLGVAPAWQAIEAGVAAAFRALGHAWEWSDCVMAAGLAGANHAGLHAAFLDGAPPLRALALETDALTTLYGAHAGAPGVVAALGTGSVVSSRDFNGEFRLIGGFGFPSGDEASGAWFGLRAIRHLQLALDGRVDSDGFSNALAASIHISNTAELVDWLASANQTRYATLAPLVFDHLDHPFAAELLKTAVEDVALMLTAADPGGELPIALTGSLGAALRPHLDVMLPPGLSKRLRPALGDSVMGALELAKRLVEFSG